MKFLYLLTFFLIHNAAYCQMDVLIPFRDKAGKIGYVTADGKIVIAPKYLQGHIFCKEGFAFVLEE